MLNNNYFLLNSVDGFINLKKLPDWTSHDCVAKVRRILNMKKVGHGGTLDPAAVGVLPIAIGKATRLLQYLPEGKGYRAIIRFGIQTTTDDLEGEIVYVEPVPSLRIAQIEALIPEFIGKIIQTPPMYSAIQVNGKRLYQLARAGEVVEVPTRTVQIDTIDILNWKPGDFPEVEVQIACGGGTYIRSIAHDLGVKLGTKGVLAYLERNGSCGFQLANSITLEELAEQQATENFKPISPDRALAHLPTVTLVNAELIKFWGQGKKLSLAQLNLTNIEDLDLHSPNFAVNYPSGYIQVIGENRCLGVGKIREIDGEYILVAQTVLL